MLKISDFSILNTDIENESIRRERVFKTGDPMATNFWKLTLKSFGNSNKEILNETYNFSINIDTNHKGLSKTAYFSHPLRVASYAAFLTGFKSPSFPILGLIHNIFEVSDIDYENIKKKFGSSIAEQIRILTVDRNKDWDSSYKKKYYETICSQPVSCRIIKILDKFDNLFILNLNPNEEIKKKYLLEVEKYIIPMAKKDLTSLHKKLKEIVDFQKRKLKTNNGSKQ